MLTQINGYDPRMILRSFDDKYLVCLYWKCLAGSYSIKGGFLFL